MKYSENNMGADLFYLKLNVLHYTHDTKLPCILYKAVLGSFLIFYYYTLRSDIVLSTFPASEPQERTITSYPIVV